MDGSKEQTAMEECNEHNSDLETAAATTIDDCDANLRFQLFQHNEA